MCVRGMEVVLFLLPRGKMTGERRTLQQQPGREGRGGKKEFEMESVWWGGEGGERGYDWLEKDRKKKNERGTERMEAGREK